MFTTESPFDFDSLLEGAPAPRREPNPLDYAVRIKPGLRFEAPREDGAVIGWTVRKGVGRGCWNAQPDGDEKARVAFHDSEIECRVEASEARRGSYSHESARTALEWWEAQPAGRVLHFTIPNGLPPFARMVFLRGVVKDNRGRKVFRATSVVAKTAEFEAAMQLPWFAKRVSEQLRTDTLPPLFTGYETGLKEPLYDPTGMEPIPAGRVGGDPETERLESLCRRAAKVLRQKSTAKRRLTPAEAVALAHAILSEGLAIRAP